MEVRPVAFATALTVRVAATHDHLRCELHRRLPRARWKRNSEGKEAQAPAFLPHEIKPRRIRRENLLRLLMKETARARGQHFHHFGSVVGAALVGAVSVSRLILGDR